MSTTSNIIIDLNILKNLKSNYTGVLVYQIKRSEYYLINCIF